ncbi:MAG TPA: TIGR03435 family protein [Verrucomicrobiae bacterium]|nr:TIGR03435 family protein [Verrucomicrobiae bacterium]
MPLGFLPNVTGSRASNLSMTRWLSAAIVLTCCTQLAGQPAAPAFASATIKRSDLRSRESSWKTPPGRLEALDWTPREYIMLAYSLTSVEQVVGGPRWVDYDRYDISAALPPPGRVPLDDKQTDAAARLALRSLLSDRFFLMLRRDSRLADGYVLTVLNRAPKLKMALPGGRHSNRWSSNELEALGTSLAGFAETLTKLLGQPVADGSGIPGAYDISLQWDTPGKPATLFAAIEQQLGLTLESRRIAQDIVTIDRIERPTQN